MDNRGSAGLDVLIFAVAFLIFVVFPVYSIVMEKAIINIKSVDIIDAIDMSNTAIYKDLNVPYTSVMIVDFNSDIDNTYNQVLAENLKLNPDMTPKVGSLAEGTVVVNSLEIYSGGFPATCPNGRVINRPTVHSVVSIPVKPSLYREIILNLAGRDQFDLVIHRDTELPVNN